MVKVIFLRTNWITLEFDKLYNIKAGRWHFGMSSASHRAVYATITTVVWQAVILIKIKTTS